MQYPASAFVDSRLVYLGPIGLVIQGHTVAAPTQAMSSDSIERIASTLGILGFFYVFHGIKRLARSFAFTAPSKLLKVERITTSQPSRSIKVGAFSAGELFGQLPGCSAIAVMARA